MSASARLAAGLKTALLPQDQFERRQDRSLAEALPPEELERSRALIHEQLMLAAGAAEPGRVLFGLAQTLRAAAGRPDATVVIAVDQAEECLGADPDGAHSPFLALLAAALSQGNGLPEPTAPRPSHDPSLTPPAGRGDPALGLSRPAPGAPEHARPGPQGAPGRPHEPAGFRGADPPSRRSRGHRAGGGFGRDHDPGHGDQRRLAPAGVHAPGAVGVAHGRALCPAGLSRFGGRAGCRGAGRRAGDGRSQAGRRAGRRRAGIAQRLLTASRDRTVRVWNTTAEAGEAVLRGHVGGIRDLQIGGRLVATAGEDHAIILWPLRRSAAAPATLPRMHRDSVEDVAFSTDLGGRFLVSGGHDNLAVVWDIAARKPVARLAEHTDDVRSDGRARG